MTITLRPDQEAWLLERVQSGQYPSVESAARLLLDQKIAELTEAPDDMAWAQPLVDEARRAVARGEAMSLDEYEIRISARREKPKR